MLDRPDLELVLAIRDHGSLSAAAQALGLAAPAVTKRLAALESRLRMRLFQRSTRRVSPTSEGEALFERAARLLQDFSELEAELQERQTEPSGTIRLASTFGFGRLWLAPALAVFQRKHPLLSVQLQLTEQLTQLGDGLDGAVWLWSIRDRAAASQWVSRRLARNQRVLAAAPDYLREHGMPAQLQELQRHACLVVRENGTPGQRFDTWQLQRDRDKTPSRVLVDGPLSSNSGEVVRDWCLSGRGIMLRSLWDISPELASGRLVQVLPAWSMVDADIHWLAPFRPQVPRRIRLLVDFLAEQFRGEPWKAISRPSPPGSRRMR